MIEKSLRGCEPLAKSAVAIGGCVHGIGVDDKP
jgi:hypothetical protein